MYLSPVLKSRQTVTIVRIFVSSAASHANCHLSVMLRKRNYRKLKLFQESIRPLSNV